MVVAGQGAQPVEDLIEEVLRAELLRDLPVDSIAHFQHALPVDRLDRRGDRSRDPPQGAPRAAVERLFPVQEGQHRPGPPAPPHRGKQEVSRKRGTLVANKPAEQPRVPVHPLRDGEDDLCGPWPGRSTATQLWVASRNSWVERRARTSALRTSRACLSWAE